MACNGRFRWVTKPFKRWAFAKGVEVTNRWCRFFATKYIVKYLRYVGKDVPAVLPRHLGDEQSKPAGRLPPQMDHRQNLRLAEHLTDILMPAADTPPTEDSRPLRATLEEAIAVALISGKATRPLAPGGAYIPLSPTPNSSPTTRSSGQQGIGIVLDLAEYAEGLGKAIDENRGLDHSKVRDYSKP